jgi:2-polyprenyl-3-methyl-5-hydroxy-6-metoxy-1,4-benzoquinol methylase
VSFYSTTVDTSVRNSSHTLIVEMVGEGARVLDVGCASGYLGTGLIAHGCEVSGVEIDPEDAEKARAVLREVKVANLNESVLDDLFEPASFDRVVFGDVLEHLLDPARAVRSAARLLRPGGAVVISVPNVAHGSLRLALLQGRWDYTDTGLLDRTHVSFFTYDSLMAMLHDEGLVVTDLRATVFDALATEVELDSAQVPPGTVDWVRAQPYAEVFQFVLSASPAAEVDGPEATVVVPAEDVPVPDDGFAEEGDRVRTALASLSDPDSAASELLELRHRLLVARDHAIGQEAQLGLLRSDAQQSQETLDFLNDELRKSHEDAHHAHTEWGRAQQRIGQLEAQLAGGFLGQARSAGGRVLRGARAAARRARNR